MDMYAILLYSCTVFGYACNGEPREKDVVAAQVGVGWVAGGRLCEVSSYRHIRTLIEMKFEVVNSKNIV